MAIIKASKVYPTIQKYIEDHELNAIGGAFCVCHKCGRLITNEDYYKDGDYGALCESCFPLEYPDESVWVEQCEEDEDDFYCTNNEYDGEIDALALMAIEVSHDAEKRGDLIDWRRNMECVDEAMAIINGAIIELRYERITLDSSIRVERWCEVVDEDNEPILEKTCKSFAKSIENLDEYRSTDPRTLAYYGLQVMIRRLSGYSVEHCVSASIALIDKYLRTKESEV